MLSNTCEGVSENATLVFHTNYDPIDYISLYCFRVISKYWSKLFIFRTLFNAPLRVARRHFVAHGFDAVTGLAGDKKV